MEHVLVTPEKLNIVPSSVNTNMFLLYVNKLIVKFSS